MPLARSIVVTMGEVRFNVTWSEALSAVLKGLVLSGFSSSVVWRAGLSGLQVAGCVLRSSVPVTLMVTATWSVEFEDVTYTVREIVDLRQIWTFTESTRAPL